MLLNRLVKERATFNRRIISDNHYLLTMHLTNAGNNARAMNGIIV